MAVGWMFQAIYASLLGQAILPGTASQATASPSSSARAFRPLVTTNYGDLSGVQTRTASGGLVDSFLGIPFAAPPVGTLRFEEPLPANRWSGVRDASVFGNECFQRNISVFRYKLTDPPPLWSEDCLYLNVYRPVTSNTTTTTSGSSLLLPVMVWIHGGAFFLGAGSQHEGSDLADNGVIVVTINYRLEIFGFLSNEDNVIPGNFGMLDQVMALKWVKDNIQSFGGDPNKVTIFGESAGSASVSLLTLSPLAKGLFQRAIMESGVSLCTWALSHPAVRVAPRQAVSLVGAIVGCNDADASKKLECFRNVNADELLNASMSVGDALEGLGVILMTPVVETKFGFLPDWPKNLWRENKFSHVDTMRGFTSTEYGFLALEIGNYSISVTNFTEGIKKQVANLAIPTLDEIVKNITARYVGDEADGHKILLELIYTLTDIFFKGPILTEANLESEMATEKNHYVYEFDYKPSNSRVPTPSWMPPIHGDEIKFVFGIDLPQFQVKGKSPTTADRAVSKQMQKLWTNFVKYGDPTKTIPFGAVKWETYDTRMAQVFNINACSQQMSYKNHESLDIFSELFKNLNTIVPDRYVVG